MLTTMVFIGGTMLGACVGVVAAGLLWMARETEEAPGRCNAIGVELLAAMVEQHCTSMPSGRVFSGGVGANQDAMLHLVMVGRMEVDATGDDGRILYARWLVPPARLHANDNARATGKGVA